MRLFHVSEKKNIRKFVPRITPHTENSVVWAIAEAKLANYLLPRDCPRVCFTVGSETSQEDRLHFLGSSEKAIAIEALWYQKAITTTLYLYEMPSNTFSLFDAIAGYYISNSVVIPLQQQIINQPIEKLLSQNVELRLLPSLWQLHDAVANSTLDFSMIRMKNAQPRSNLI
jgi:hypothetical protein